MHERQVFLSSRIALGNMSLHGPSFPVPSPFRRSMLVRINHLLLQFVYRHVLIRAGANIRYCLISLLILLPNFLFPFLCCLPSVVQAEVRFYEEVLSADEIARGITGLGYKCQHTRTTGPTSGGEGGAGSEQPSVIEVEVSGMSCTSCSGKVRKAPHACTLFMIYHSSARRLRL